MSWSYVVIAQAQRDIKKLDSQVRRRVGAAIKRLAATWPQSVSIAKLTDVDPPEYRLRVGDWRVRFRTDTAAKLLTVVRVLKRGEAYER